MNRVATVTIGEADYIIVGGDFNTVTRGDVMDLEAMFADCGLIRASVGTGHTASKYWVEATSDHIFSKGFAVEEVGKAANATASDHMPIWARLKPRPETAPKPPLK